mmetsp:Transcript_87732/g.253033  ORF Transcript_87732/g.253033 Transcript_87732/m.253033 type:complete len:234 (+) Transcript_87732:1230-1931(+)
MKGGPMSKGASKIRRMSRCEILSRTARTASTSTFLAVSAFFKASLRRCRRLARACALPCALDRRLRVRMESRVADPIAASGVSSAAAAAAALEALDPRRWEGLLSPEPGGKSSVAAGGTTTMLLWLLPPAELTGAIPSWRSSELGRRSDAAMPTRLTAAAAAWAIWAAVGERQVPLPSSSSVDSPESSPDADDSTSPSSSLLASSKKPISSIDTNTKAECRRLSPADMLVLLR